VVARQEALSLLLVMALLLDLALVVLEQFVGTVVVQVAGRTGRRPLDSLVATGDRSGESTGFGQSCRLSRGLGRNGGLC